MPKKKNHSFSRNAREFGYLAMVLLWPDSDTRWHATLAWHVREWDGEFVSEHLTLNEAKQKCLEYEEAIREKAWELESVQAFNRAKQYDAFAANWILRNSGRILPKLVALHLL